MKSSVERGGYRAMQSGTADCSSVSQHSTTGVSLVLQSAVSAVSAVAVGSVSSGSQQCQQCQQWQSAVSAVAVSSDSP